MTFLEAVAREEGFYAKGTRPQRNNNPGDLEFHPFLFHWGATHGDPRFAVFDTPGHGFAAMKSVFQSPHYKGLTVAQALNRWAPGVENSTSEYTANVCEWVGCSPNDVIDALVEA